MELNLLSQATLESRGAVVDGLQKACYARGDAQQLPLLLVGEELIEL